jgi:hypothetical protein
VRRPDLLDGLGIYVGASEVALAHVSKRLLQVRLRHRQVFPLPSASQVDERRQALVEAVTEFAHAHDVDTTHTVLCLPRSDAAVTRVLLPAAAQENLAQVLEYEIENLLPLARDDVHYDYSVRPHGTERVEVLVLALPRAVVQGYLDALDAANVRPRRVVLASTAIADYVTFCRGDAAAPLGIVVATPSATEVALVANGRLLASQLVPTARAADGAALERAIARQMADELLDPEQVTLYRWTLANGTPVASPTDNDDLLALARAKLGAADDVAAAPASTLPAVGAALAAVREGAVEMNLLPAELREAFDEGPSIATWILLAASVVLLLLWGGSVIAKDLMLRSELAAKLEAIAPDVREVKTVQSEIDELQRQVDILGPLQDGRVTTLLKDLTELIPTDAYLTSLNLRGSRLTLDGHARSASDIITALEKSKRFKNVTFSSPTTRQGDKERFSLSAEVLK